MNSFLVVLLSRRVLQRTFPRITVNTGVTGVIDEGDTRVTGEGYREYGDTRGYIVGNIIRF